MKNEFPEIYEILYLEGKALFKDHIKIKKKSIKHCLAEMHKENEGHGFSLFNKNKRDEDKSSNDQSLTS